MWPTQSSRVKSVSGGQESFKLQTIENYPSKCICVGELAPYTVRLIIKQDWEECKFSIGLQCTAQESGSENDRALDTSVLLEDEFESYLVEMSEEREVDDGECRSANAKEERHTNEETHTNGSIGLPTFPRLLRVPTNGSPCLPFTVGRGSSWPGSTSTVPAFIYLTSWTLQAVQEFAASRTRLAPDGSTNSIGIRKSSTFLAACRLTEVLQSCCGCLYAEERELSGGQEGVASPWVFDPREYRRKLSVAEWRALVGEEGHDADGDDKLTASEETKIICIPMFIRLRRSGCFDIRVTVDVNLDDIIQRLTTTCAVNCQRCLNLSSRLVSLPATGTCGPCEARRVNVTNVSGIALQLTDLKFCAVEGQSLPTDAAGMVAFSTSYFVLRLVVSVD